MKICTCNLLAVFWEDADVKSNYPPSHECTLEEKMKGIHESHHNTFYSTQVLALYRRYRTRARGIPYFCTPLIYSWRFSEAILSRGDAVTPPPPPRILKRAIPRWLRVDLLIYHVPA